MASQPPGDIFPLPKGARLMAREKLVLTLPTAILAENETFADVIDCDDDARMSIPPGSDAIYIKLSKGMTISLSKSTQMAIVAKDDRSRSVAIKLPEGTAEQDASPSDGAD